MTTVQYCFQGVRRQQAHETHRWAFNNLRPLCSRKEARALGIFTALRTRVGDRILQDGVGFPFLSHLCYRFIACGEDKALQYVSPVDGRGS